MKNGLKHKLFMGFCGFMVRIPPLLSEKGARRGEEGVRKNAHSLSGEERRLHHHVVRRMALAEDPISVELIAGELGMPEDKVLDIVNKLEDLKTFIYRSDRVGIDWAYPLSLVDTGFRVVASSGERFFAA